MDLRADLMRTLGRADDPVLECRETHISWVFLRKDDVWKVKKPVSLGFLNFGTLTSRKAACDAEVRLNRRLAPEVYLGVVPVRLKGNGAASVEGDGEIVDWAVHMKRLPDASRADVLLSEGHLSEADVERIAEHLARFHAKSAGGPDVARFGAPEAIAESVRENFAQTVEAVGHELSRDATAEVEHWQTAFLAEHARTFHARQSEGRVRDGHGDLRLEHVYLSETDEITILDCIEFNERFRYGDVCADLGFLSMDLAFHGRVDLAEHLLAVYAREANDYDLYAVVDFYESYRAFVRAKVATMLARDEGAPEEARARAEKEARRYLLLAQSADRRSLLAPSVIAVGGVIGSGKSTIAGFLAAELAAPIVDADRTRKHMLGLRPTEHAAGGAWSGAYDPAFTDKVYAEVLRRADAVLASGRPVILDASFRSRTMRSAARDLATKHAVPFTLVECRATPEVCRARLEARDQGESVSDGRLSVFDTFVARFEAMNELEAVEHIVLDTTRPREATLAALRRSLQTWPRGLVA